MRAESGLKICRLKTSCILSLLWGKLRSRVIIPPLAPKLSPIRNLALQSLRFQPKSLAEKNKTKKQSIQVSSPVAVPAGSRGSPPQDQAPLTTLRPHNCYSQLLCSAPGENPWPGFFGMALLSSIPLGAPQHIPGVRCGSGTQDTGSAG